MATSRDEPRTTKSRRKAAAAAKPAPSAAAAAGGFFTIYKKGQGYWTRMGTAVGRGAARHSDR